MVLVNRNDLNIEMYCSPGPGGSNKNRSKNSCRMTHKESGVTVQATKQRSAQQNVQDAFIALTNHPDFKLWLSRKLVDIRTNSTIEERVDKQLQEKNLLVETLVDGQWVELV